MKALSLFTLIFASMYSLAQCDDFSVTINATNPICVDFSDGSVTAIVAGGTTPYAIEITNTDGILVNVGATANSLPEGWYYVSVEDSDVCSFLDSVYLDDGEAFEIETTIMDCTDGCNGSVRIDTVLNYHGDYENLSIFWSPDPNDINGMGAFEQTNLCEETFTITLNDESGCSAVFTSISLSCVATINEESRSPYHVNYDTTEKQFTLTGWDQTTTLNMQIYTVNGTVLSEKSVNTAETISLASLHSGIYIYSFSSSDGIRLTGKFSVTH